MSSWIDKFLSLQIDGVVSLWVDEFVSLWVDAMMYSGVVGFSWVIGLSQVDKPVRWFVLRFVYERGVYLVLASQRQ